MIKKKTLACVCTIYKYDKTQKKMLQQGESTMKQHIL